MQDASHYAPNGVTFVVAELDFREGLVYTYMMIIDKDKLLRPALH